MDFFSNGLFLGGIQNFLKYHTDSYELDKRQQAIFPGFGRKSARGLCGITGRRAGAGSIMVFKYSMRRLARRPGNGQTHPGILWDVRP